MRSVRARAAVLVGDEDLVHQRALARGVAVDVRDLREPIARLDGRLERLRVLLQVAVVGLGGERAVGRGVGGARLAGLDAVRIARAARSYSVAACHSAARARVAPSALVGAARCARTRAAAGAHCCFSLYASASGPVTSGCSGLFGKRWRKSSSVRDRAVPVLQRDQRRGGVVLRRSRGPPIPARPTATRAKCRRGLACLPAARACSPCL